MEFPGSVSVRHALKWSFLSELASKAVQPLVFIILARLLTPEDFGVVAAAVMVISFTQIFWEAGMGKAIIQYQGDRAAATNAAFWINNALGVVVVGVLVAISSWVADRIFHDPRVVLVLRFMALQVFLSASVSVHVAVLQKDMQFKHLFWVRLATVTVPGLASIPLAWYGMGYWALVVGTLVGQVVQATILWKTSPWRPRWSFDPAVAKQLGRFGGWVAASGLLAWFYMWADSLILGMYLGSHELGLYRTGNVFVTMIFGFLFGPLVPVLYSHLSGIQHDRERVRANLFKVIKIITFISIPIALLVYANAPFIAEVVFGAKWKGVELVIAVMALMHGYSWVVGANGEAYRAVGVPAYETKIMAFNLIFYMTGFWLSIQHGFEAFIWTRLGLALAASSVHLWIAKKVVSLDVKPTLAYVLKISLLCLPVVLLSYLLQYYNTIFYQIMNLVVGVFLIISALWMVERNGLIPSVAALAKKRNTQ